MPLARLCLLACSDSGSGQWIWKVEGNDLAFEQEESVRFRVTAVRFPPIPTPAQLKAAYLLPPGGSRDIPTDPGLSAAPQSKRLLWKCRSLARRRDRGGGWDQRPAVRAHGCHGNGGGPGAGGRPVVAGNRGGAGGSRCSDGC